MTYTYGGFTLCAGTFQSPSVSSIFCNSLIICQHNLNGPSTPLMQRLTAITHKRFGLLRVRSPLLAESRLFSFPVGTEMFHFPTFPPTTLCVQVEVAGHDSGISRFPYSEIHGLACLPAPRGLSQVTTSFFGSRCQGIHQLPLVACYFTTKMLASTVKFSRNGRAQNLG